MINDSIKKINEFILKKPPINYNHAKIKISNYINKQDYTGLKKLILRYNKKGYSKTSLYKFAFSMSKDINIHQAKFFAEEVIKEECDPKFIQVYRTRLKWIGEHKRSAELNALMITQSNTARKQTYHQVKATLNAEYKNLGIDDLINAFSKYEDTAFALSLAKYIFSIAKNHDTKKALDFIKHYLDKINDTSYLKVVSNRYNQLGYTKESQLILSYIAEHSEVKEFSNNLNFLINQKDEAIFDVQHYVEHCLNKINDKTGAYKAIFSILKDRQAIYAIEYGVKYVNTSAHIDDAFYSVFALRLMRLDRDSEAYKIYLKLYLKNRDQRKNIEDKLIKVFSKINKEKIILACKNNKPSVLIKRLLPKPIKNNKNIVSKIIFDTCKNDSSLEKLAIIHAHHILKDNDDSYLSLALSNLYFKQGKINAALTVKGLSKNNPKHALKLSHYHAYKNLLENGFSLPDKTTKKTANNKVLYCLHNSLPYHSGGYATRSHGLARGIKNNHWDIAICSRLGYPHDLSSHKNADINQQEIDHVDSLNYHRLFTDINQYGVANLTDYITSYALALTQLAAKLDISIIHGASNFMNGIAANCAARSLGIKSVYEVRGLWEITRMSRQPEWQDSEHFNMIKRLETEAAMHADAVLTITYALKAEMVKRGVDENKITVVSNGVHVDRFVPKPRVVELEQQLGYVSKVVIGFIGSVVSYEGLEHLVQAASILKIKGINNFVVMIVGDGAVLDDIKALVNHLELNNIFTFTGRVPHEVVEDYYSLVDIAPFPRIGVPVCEMVSPLKPFEAMSMGKAVVSSNVAALTEIVNHGITGLTFKKDSSIDFANILEQLINDPELRTQLGKNAREWVVKEKDWSMLATKISEVYREISDA